MLLAFLLLFLSGNGFAGEVTTNTVRMPNAPAWVNASRVDRVVDRIQNLLQWDIRRVSVTFYTNQDEFQKMHALGPLVLALSKKSENVVTIGPKVTDSNFDAVFGHEMVHIISYQKFHGAIPAWLEEGLANYLAKQGEVNYTWLGTQPAPNDVHDLTHPFNGSADHTRYSYMASQALAEMIASKCDLEDLLQLAVGKRLETYLDTTCEIHDLTGEFKKWLDSHKGKKS